MSETAARSYAGLLTALSFGSDLNMGQSIEHGLKTVWMAMHIGRALDLTHHELMSVYYGGLLKDAG